jgi:aryl-alcohol dehydrogenase-like predicted oxidoreductase
MKYRLLGHTGLKVSELCLGTMTFGSKFLNIGCLGQKEADQFVARSLEAKINFFDTADVYSRGESEEILGQSFKNLKVERDSVVIATKVRGAMSDAAMSGTGDVNNVGLTRKHIMSSVEKSLRRLQTDHIDLYQVHGVDRLTPIDETLRALSDLVDQGKVRYLGCSNWPARHLAEAITSTSLRGLNGFVSLQAYYSLAGRDLEYELLPLCQEKNLAVLPWSPLSGGFLSGKYKKNEAAPEGARRANFNFPPVDEVRVFDAIAALEEIAQNRNCTVSQVALSWLLHQKGVTSVIIGASKMHQLEDNLKATELVLSEDELKKLAATTTPRAMYPNWMIERQNTGR